MASSLLAKPKTCGSSRAGSGEMSACTKLASSPSASVTHGMKMTGSCFHQSAAGAGGLKIRSEASRCHASLILKMGDALNWGKSWSRDSIQPLQQTPAGHAFGRGGHKPAESFLCTTLYQL